jgi:type IV pilus assembly protein PilQ
MNRKIVILSIMFLLIPLITMGQTQKRQVSLVSFDFMDADVRNVLRLLTQVSGKNIVISDDVKGRVTMRLDNVSWDEALDMILKTSGLERIEEENIIRILSAKKMDEEQKRLVDKKLELLKEKQEKLKTKEDFITETVFLNFADASEFEKIIKGIYPDIQVTVVKANNAMIVSTVKERLDQIKKRIQELDVRPAMVQIEARIVEATTSFTRDLGVQWGTRYNGRILGEQTELSGSKNAPTTGASGSRDSTTIPYNVNLPAAIGSTAGGGSLGIYIGSVKDSLQLDVQLSALETSGKGKIISHPKVVTSDNKKAIINQGKEIPYATVSQSGTQTQFKLATLSLTVTPQVTKDGHVKMQILATKDAPDFTQDTGAGPPIDKKSAETEVIVKDGETALIGGIYETTDEQSGTGVPFLQHIPLLGWLFKRDTKNIDKNELLIFITPTILKNLYADEG